MALVTRRAALLDRLMYDHPLLGRHIDIVVAVGAYLEVSALHEVGIVGIVRLVTRRAGPGLDRFVYVLLAADNILLFVAGATQFVNLAGFQQHLIAGVVRIVAAGAVALGNGLVSHLAADGLEMAG